MKERENSELKFDSKKKKIIKPVKKDRIEFKNSFHSNREVDDTTIPYTPKKKKVIKDLKK